MRALPFSGLSSEDWAGARELLAAALAEGRRGDPGWWEAARCRAVGGMQDRAKGRDARIGWARVALLAVEGKGVAAGSDTVRQLAERAAVCAYAVVRLDAAAEVPEADPAALFRAAAEAMGELPPGLAAGAVRWRELEHAEILRLRLWKNLLRRLADLAAYVPDQNLRAWYGAWADAAESFP